MHFPTLPISCVVAWQWIFKSWLGTPRISGLFSCTKCLQSDHAPTSASDREWTFIWNISSNPDVTMMVSHLKGRESFHSFKRGGFATADTWGRWVTKAFFSAKYIWINSFAIWWFESLMSKLKLEIVSLFLSRSNKKFDTLQDEQSI